MELEVVVTVCWPTSVTDEEVEVVEPVEAEVVAGVTAAVVPGSAKTPAAFATTAATNKRAMTAVATPSLPVARLSPSLERHRPFVNRPAE
jgi:hypothetical protein